MDRELEVIKNRLQSGFPQGSEVPEDDEEKKQATEALMVIVKYILRSTDQDKMADWISGLEQINQTDHLHWSQIPSGSGSSLRCDVR